MPFTHIYDRILIHRLVSLNMHDLTFYCDGVEVKLGPGPVGAMQSAKPI